jgi:hypothetical protein
MVRDSTDDLGTPIRSVEKSPRRTSGCPVQGTILYQRRDASLGLALS